MPNKSYKYCVVPKCTNTSIATPEKLFFNVPDDPATRKKWMVAMRRENKISNKSHKQCCEDHFSLPDDMQNYLEFKLTSHIQRLRLRKGVVPHIFKCQDRNATTVFTERKAVSKRKHIQLVSDAAKEFTIEPQPGPSTLPDIPDTTMESEELKQKEQGVQVNLTPCKKYRSKSIQTVKTWVTSSSSSPLKSFTKSFATSPIKATESCPVKCRVAKKLLVEEVYSDSSTSEETSDRLSEFHVQGETSTDYSTEEEEKTSTFKSHMLKGTMMAIEKEPKLYLGLPQKMFYLIQMLSDRIPLPHRDIFIVLKKVRLHDSFAILGIDFGMSLSNVSRIFKNCVPVMAKYLEELIIWPDSRRIKLHLPIPFRSRYGKVQSIIDCLEIEIEKPTNPVHQALTWSEYKGCNTLKYLISCTPDGLVTFISPGYGGRAADTTIIEDCGYLDKVRPNSSVMADRGFKNVSNILLARDCTLVRPPSVQKKCKSSPCDVKLSKQIAALRIHVERLIGRLREFHMLLPHACIDNHLVSYMDYIVIIVCGIVNIQDHLIKIQI